MSAKSKKSEELTEEEIKEVKIKIAEITELFRMSAAVKKNKKIPWQKIRQKRLELPGLTKDKELELGRLLRDGSEKEKKRAENQLFWANQGIVIYCAADYYGKGDIIPDFQKLIDTGNEGLKAAIKKYDYRKNYTLGAYAKYYILGNLCKKTAIREKTGSLDMSDEDGRTLYDRNASEEDLPDAPAAFWGSDRIDRLTDKEQKVLGQLFDSSCLSLEEAAAELNLSREKVRQIRDKALFKLNKSKDMKSHIEDYLK